MEKIVEDLDPVQITRIFFALLYRYSINAEAAGAFYKIEEELTITFLSRFLQLNTKTYKKINIINDYLCKILDHVDIT